MSTFFNFARHRKLTYSNLSGNALNGIGQNLFSLTRDSFIFVEIIRNDADSGPHGGTAAQIYTVSGNNTRFICYPELGGFVTSGYAKNGESVAIKLASSSSTYIIHVFELGDNV